MPSPRVMACPMTPGRKSAAAIGQGRHGIVVVAQVRVAPEDAMLLVEDVIDAAVELILVVRFDAR